MSQGKQGVGVGGQASWLDSWKKNGSTKRTSREFGIFKITIPQTSVWGPAYGSIKVSDFFFSPQRETAWGISLYLWVPWASRTKSEPNIYGEVLCCVLSREKAPKGKEDLSENVEVRVLTQNRELGQGRVTLHRTKSSCPLKASLVPRHRFQPGECTHIQIIWSPFTEGTLCERSRRPQQR